jgi:hypothetical protein
MVTTCQTDADVGASDIERPVSHLPGGGLWALAAACLASSLPIFEADRVTGARAIYDR